MLRDHENGHSEEDIHETSVDVYTFGETVQKNKDTNKNMGKTLERIKVDNPTQSYR